MAIVLVFLFCMMGETWNIPAISGTPIYESTFTTVTSYLNVSHSTRQDDTSLHVHTYPYKTTMSVSPAPSNVTGLRCEYSWSSRALILVWDAAHGVEPVYEVQVNAESPMIITETRYQIDDVLSAEHYDISVTSLSGDKRSHPVSIKCQTKLRGVVIGSVVAVLFVLVFIGLLLLVCGVYSKLRILSCKSANQQRVGQGRINARTHNTEDHHNSKSECTDMTTDGNQQYEALDMMTFANTPYESCRPSHISNKPSVIEGNTSDVDLYENIPN